MDGRTGREGGRDGDRAEAVLVEVVEDGDGGGMMVVVVVVVREGRKSKDRGQMLAEVELCCAVLCDGQEAVLRDSGGEDSGESVLKPPRMDDGGDDGRGSQLLAQWG